MAAGTGALLNGAIIYTALAVVALVVSTWGDSPHSAWIKMAASTGFLAIALAAGAWQMPYGRAVLVALICCWWGDLFLTSSRESVFLLGLGAFLLGHLAFGGAFLLQGINGRAVAAGALLALAVAIPVLRWLDPHLGGLRYPVYAYTAVISLMLALAIGAWGNGATRWIALGALLFFISDLFVARQKFVTPTVWNPLFGLPTYYAAQVLLAWSITRVNPPES